MNTLQTQSELPKTPLVLDLTKNNNDVSAVQTVITAERAQRLQTIAGEIGGFSVSIIANEGDPYKTIYDTGDGLKVRDSRKVTSTLMSVDEGMVIVSMQNISNPETPKDLSALYQALSTEQ